VWVERPGAALRPTPQAGDDVLGLNLTRGCVHRCGFCSVRAAPSYPGDDFVYLYADTAEQLATELAARHRRPRAVLLCPAADPFPPVVEVQAEAGRAVEVIAKHGVEAWLMTRGLIRPAVRELLAVYRRHVRVTVPFVTVRRDWQRLLEPWAAPPRLRLRQLSTLRELGIAAQVTLEPLLPELTDTPENLDSLLRALAAAGVRHVTAGYAFVREGIAENLRKDLDRHGWAEPVLAAYEGGPVLTAAGLAPARYLPRPRRQRGYAALMALAATHGISVSVSRLTNPDFAVPSDPGPPRPRQRLLSLFLQSAGRDEPSPEAAGRD
jgi:DNA repair photolyase